MSLASHLENFDSLVMQLIYASASELYPLTSTEQVKTDKASEMVNDLKS